MWTLLHADVGGSGRFSPSFNNCQSFKQYAKSLQASDNPLDVSLGLFLRTSAIVERSHGP